MEAYLDDTFQYLPPEGRQVAQLFQLNLIALTLIKIGERFFIVLGGNGSGRSQYVLEPAERIECTVEAWF